MSIDVHEFVIALLIACSVGFIMGAWLENMTTRWALKEMRDQLKKVRADLTSEDDHTSIFHKRQAG